MPSPHPQDLRRAKAEDDHTLAAGAVIRLRELANRKRETPLYDVFSHAADGAAVAETLVLGARGRKRAIA